MAERRALLCVLKGSRRAMLCAPPHSESHLANPVKIFANLSWLRFNSGCEMANLIENSLNATGRALVMKNATIAI